MPSRRIFAAACRRKMLRRCGMSWMVRRTPIATAALAAEAIDSGRARDKLAALVAITTSGD